jgi:dTDP-4-dehydrorhamnose reductase
MRPPCAQWCTHGTIECHTLLKCGTLQEEKLRLKEQCKFFIDEFRSPVAICDIIRIINWLLAGSVEAASMTKSVLNMGGPHRLSRYDMATAVAQHCGLSMDCVERASSVSVTRAAPSPLDISMDSSRLQEALPFKLLPFQQGLAEVFGPAVEGCTCSTRENSDT